ncbi:ComEC/Rec2 family competence protein [Virgibacillus sp. W0181]|uniref:ComEC/Rec2 family competence protein n=1 Tax=Virgibacillus sp. W0181 TaxID=3391581 RepID=UPI003F470AC8
MRNYFIYFILLAILLGLFPENIKSKTSSDMNVHFIDVGQGDSILIETPANKIILIDGGPPKAGDQVVSYLKKQRIEKIDLLIATHPDYDHIGGLIEVIKEFEIDQVVDSGKLHTTKTFFRYMNQIRKNSIPINFVQQHDQLYVDPAVQINVLNSFSKNKNNNQSSIVLKITYGEVDFLFMGDAEDEQEKRLAKRNDIEAEIVKVGHHGSKTSSSFAFLERVNPSVAMLTYKKRNKYGHPVNRVIANLNRMNVQLYSTAVFGNVVITTNGQDYYVLPEKSPLEGLLKSS